MLNQVAEHNDLLLQVLNTQAHLSLFSQVVDCFSDVKPSTQINDKVLISGKLYYYSPQQYRYVTKYFEVHPNVLLKYDDPTKKGPPQFVYCHLFKLYEDNVQNNSFVVSGLIMELESTILKIAFLNKKVQ